jgi:phage gpG-like protein
MTASVSITINDKAFKGAMRALKKDLTGQGMREGLTVAGVVLQQSSARAFRTQSDPATGTPWRPTSGLTLGSRPGGGQDGKTLQDTNLLFKSVVSAKPMVEKDSVSISTNRPGANVHQTGRPAIIRPKRSKLLAIPMTREARKAGGASQFWRRAEQSGRQVWIQKAKSGKLYIFATVSANNADFAPMFALKPFVKTVARPFIGTNADDRRKIADIFVVRITKALQSGGL